MLVTKDLSEALYLSARNLPNIGICDVEAVDPVSLVRFDKVVMTVAAVAKLEEALA
jgi:large subunit ribosomal protein L4